MKKYSNLIISGVLIICALLCTFTDSFKSVTAGQGLGKNTDIVSVEGLSSLLDYISNYEVKPKEESNPKIINTSYTPSMISVISEDVDEIVDKAQYKGVTIVENSDMKCRVVSKRVNGYSSYFPYQPTYEYLSATTISFTRELTVYMTETASYYVSRGTARINTESYSSDVTSSERYMDFDMKIYISYDVAYVNINKLTISDSDELKHIKSKYKNVWLQLPTDGAGELLSLINEANQDTFSMIEECIKKAREDDGENSFEEDGDIYTYEEELFNLSIDLSESNSPYITLKYDDPGDTDDGNRKEYYYIYDTLAFKYIDNTVVNLNIDPAYVIKDTDDLEAIFK